MALTLDLHSQLGPFVDASHPLLKAGDVDETPQELFQRTISPKLTAFLDYSTNTSIILVPSVRDLISHNVVYPQAPLEREGLNLHKVSRFKWDKSTVSSEYGTLTSLPLDREPSYFPTLQSFQLTKSSSPSLRQTLCSH